MPRVWALRIWSRTLPLPSQQRGGFAYLLEDNGQHWSNPDLVFRQAADWWFVTPYNFGFGFREFYTTVDPKDSNHLYGTTSSIIRPVIDWRSIYFNGAEMEGKLFHTSKKFPRIWDDPVWQAKYFFPGPIIDPLYYIYGGYTFLYQHLLVLDGKCALANTYRSCLSRERGVFYLIKPIGLLLGRWIAAKRGARSQGRQRILLNVIHSMTPGSLEG